MSSLCGWMQKERLTEHDLMENVEVPRAPRKVREILTVEQLDTLIRMADGHTIDRRRDAAMIAMLVETGVRVGELVSIDLDDLDLVERTIEVDGKTGPRKVPFGYRTDRLIQKYLRVRGQYSHARETQALWVGDRGALSVDGVAQALARASERAGLGRVSPHAIRHAAAHQWMSQGLPDRLVESLMGWSRGSGMTRFYAADLEEQRAIEAYVSPLDTRERDRTRR